MKTVAKKRVGTLADQFRKLHEAIAELRESKSIVSGTMKKLGIDGFEFQDGKKLVLERSSDRVVTMKDLGRFLSDPDLAKKIWARFPKRTSEYYTVIPTRLQMAVK